MLDVFTTYYAENPGSLMQLAICVGLFAACYIISRVVRYKVCPWLVAKSEKRIKKVLFIFVRGFAKPLPVLVWSIGLYFALLALPLLQKRRRSSTLCWPKWAPTRWLLSRR